MILKTTRELMALALDKCREGVDGGQTPFGAVVARRVDGGFEVLSAAHNSVFADTDITAHAEVNAIRAACKKTGSVKLTDCVIASTTEPCPMCFSAIHWAGIGEIFYGANIADAAAAGFRELNIANESMCRLGGAEIRVTGGVLKDECVELFSYWGGKGRVRTY